MSPLERLGLEVAAFQLLGSRARAASLCALVHASGVTISYEALANARVVSGETASARPEKVAQIRVCLLRECLEDVGLEGVIHSMPSGYALPEPGRTAVIERLVEVAGQ